MSNRFKAVSLLLAVALLLATVGVVVAQGPTGTYGSGITCTNLGTAPASISVSFYVADTGAVALTYTDPSPVAVGASRNYFTPSTPPGLPSGFLGSAVVSSDQPMSCNVNTQIVGTGVGTARNPARAGSSAGVGSADASTSIFAPQVMKALAGTYNSYVAVQNTESTAQTVYVNYASSAGVAYPAARESVTIPAQASHVFYQLSNANLPNGFIGGATITSTGKIAGVVNFYNNGATAAKTQFNSYTAFSSGANLVVAPRFVRNFYGYNGGLTIQNVGAAPTSVAITFSFGGTPYVMNTGTIAPGATFAPYAPNIAVLAPVDSMPVGARFGSIVMQAAAGGSIVAIVNEDNRGTCNAAACPPIPPEQVGFSGSYNAMPDSAKTSTVFFIQVPRKAGGFISGGFQFANTTGTATTCSLTFPSAPAANQTGVALAANGSLSYFAPNIPSLPDGFNSSVKVTCGQPIVGISNFSARSATYFGDSFVVANGLNQ